MPKRAIVTGASGAIGRRVVERLARRGDEVLAIGRKAARGAGLAFPVTTLAEAERTAETTAASVTPPVLVHAAGISGRGQCSERSMAEAARFASETIALAHGQGAQKAILLSSIYASLSERGQPTRYGDHKRQIEELFCHAFLGHLIVLRLPPVYGGESDTSSIAALAKLIARGVPLPLGCAKAERDYLAMSNLVDLIERIVSEQVAGAQTARDVIYEPSDGFAVSTRQIARYLGPVVGRPVRLLPVPAAAMRALAGLVGRGELVSAAFTPLRTEGVDRLLNDYGWMPATHMPLSLDYLASRPAT